MPTKYEVVSETPEKDHVRQKIVYDTVYGDRVTAYLLIPNSVRESGKRAPAVLAALTYEIHGDKQDFDLQPGQNLTLNWGISQFLPLRKDQQLLLEVGLTGYSSWQITDDSGSDAGNPSVHDDAHAVGGQLGLTYVPWFASLNLHYFGEFAAQDRFQGQVFGFSLAKKF